MAKNQLNGLEYLKSLSNWTGIEKFGLDNISRVLESFGSPQNTYKTIHVAGTNGKGSVCIGLATCLAGLGFKVGLTISPHLVSINERIVINGSPIDDESLANFAERVQTSAARHSLSLSFFEAITACAFIAFREERVDYAVIETGLGGRLDATNLISRPEVSIITSISYDHERQLGSSLEQIASEKAGIIKTGVPVICGDLPREARGVIARRALELGAGSYFIGENISLRKSSPEQWRVKFEDEPELELRPSLNGEHQGANMALVVSALCKLGFSSDQFVRYLSQLKWPGRLEKVRVGETNVLFDCAHNVSGVESLVAYIDQHIRSKVIFVFGALQTKRWDEMLNLLIPLAKEFHFVEPPSDVAVSSGDMSRLVSGSGVKNIEWGNDYRGVVDSVLRDNRERNEEAVVVCGSIYLIGRLYKEINNHINRLW